jgi:TetR/AcrR family transcriptional regulator, regulator of biofilm formation and stress response
MAKQAVKKRVSKVGSVVPSSSLQPGPPTQRGVARRQALLGAAIRVVATSGVAALTHREIARVARLPLAATTYYFESKSALVVATFESVTQKRIAELDAAAAAMPAKLAIATAARVWAETLARRMRDERGLVLAEFELHLEAARAPELRAIHVLWETKVMAVLSQAMCALGSNHATADAALIFAVLTGLEIGELANETPAASVTLIQPLLHRLLAGLLK